MKTLVPIIKKVEIELRAHGNIKSESLWEELSNLSDWEYRIVQDAMLRVNMSVANGNDNFVYKLYESNDKPSVSKTKKVDLLICTLKRDFHDTCMTDVVNRVVVPTHLTHDSIEIWGEHVTKARNMAVHKALEMNARYLVFVDDDIIAPNNVLLKLFELMDKTKRLVVAGNYYRKINPLVSAHGTLDKYENYDSVFETDLCAMGIVLMDIDQISNKVPLPLFWEFGAPDGFWSMGEDAFFTRNLINYAKEKPLVDTSIKSLHYDKVWKCCYGERDDQVTYATNHIPDIEKFERLRVPEKYPSILIGIPTRKQDDPVAVSLEKLVLLRGYRSEMYNVYGLGVDHARTNIIKEALKRGCNYALFIDNDIIPPIDGLCKVLNHIEKDKDLGAVSGDYVMKGQPLHSAHLQLNEDGMVTELNRLPTDDLVYSNWLIGLGFCLVDMNMFKQMREPWFKCHYKKEDNDKNVNEDAHFTEMAFENGYKVLVDKTIKCGHVDYKNEKLYSLDSIDLNDYAGFDWATNLNTIKG